MRAAIVALVIITSAAGCAVFDAASGGGDDDDDGGGGNVVAGVFPNQVNPDLDLLLVIDNTNGMTERQNAFALDAPTLINALNTIPGGLPSVHVGVVSTDMGVGSNTVQTCTAIGDGGRLLKPTACTGITGNYLSDVRQPGGSRQRNYTGSLDTSLGCLVRLGAAGCGFEQPLASMRAALGAAANPGFLRPTAALAVVIFTNEDDCSAGEGLYSPSDSSLGAFTSFRCFEHGVVCNEPANQRGLHTGCRPAPAPTRFMHLVEDHTSFLRALKPSASPISVTVIAGPVDPVTVIDEPNNPANSALDGSCTTAAGPSVPGVRLAGFTRQLAAGGVTTATTSSCASDYESAMVTTVAAIQNSIGLTRCLNGALRDTDSRMPGVQPSCQVSDDAGSIPACDASGAHPCWRMAVDPVVCSYTTTQLSISIERDVPLTSGHVTVNCTGA